ncbi:helix-turn-helix domain-containing protein [Solihabitans fulvus]|uniref:Helix-turn-helix domain-containing protein n=1 Tax=Solihabitans fulvus TaxID=1892852 RepID=A0A5B2WS72_9PSEU|nr:helix-turn-helix transcriptional regulator [Solihabitans fulvus]KAA2253834.1 helix-turn-helix domain-containing protein [Solihabitans fulvus]
MHSDNRLGEYLRARRELVRPENHAMPAPGRRRVPGLRREEVAMLAGVSTDYYVRLEQGRERHPSAQVLDALAGAFGLDAEAVAHLHGLAGPAPRRRRRSARPEQAGPGLVALLGRWRDTPALVLGRRLDLLACNELGAALFGWLGEERNLVRALFLRPDAREFYGAWETVASNCLAALRASGDVDDPALTDLVGELTLKSPEFARLWARHDVRTKTTEAKRFRHPLVGELTLRYEAFTVNSAPGQQLVVYQAEPGSSSEGALALLGSLAAAPVEGRNSSAPSALDG